MMETLACLKEFHLYCARKFGEHKSFSICSLGMDAQTESFQALERWADALLVITQTSNPRELCFHSINKQQDPTNLRAVFSVTSTLEIQSIHFESE